jgi:hypothetical protein
MLIQTVDAAVMLPEVPFEIPQLIVPSVDLTAFFLPADRDHCIDMISSQVASQGRDVCRPAADS